MAPTFSRKTERNKKVEGERQVQAFTKQITRSFLPHSLVQCNLKHLQKYYKHSILPFKRFSSVVVRVWQFPGIWMHSKYDSYISQLQNKWFALNFKFQRNASKFAIFWYKENPCNFFCFSFRATLTFSIMNTLVYVVIDQGIHKLKLLKMYDKKKITRVFFII